jgi:hypothetical protein
MSKDARSRRDLLMSAAKAAALGISGTALLSGMSCFATPSTLASAPPMNVFARENKIELRGLTLAWYGVMGWTASLASRAEAERKLTDHIETIVSRYRGAIPSWDVVNEPLAEWPANFQKLELNHGLKPS